MLNKSREEIVYNLMLGCIGNENYKYNSKEGVKLAINMSNELIKNGIKYDKEKKFEYKHGEAIYDIYKTCIANYKSFDSVEFIHEIASLYIMEFEEQMGVNFNRESVYIKDTDQAKLELMSESLREGEFGFGYDSPCEYVEKMVNVLSNKGIKVDIEDEISV